MNLDDAEAMAVSLIAGHIDEKGWTFKFDNAKTRLGHCRDATKTIYISRHLVLLNDEDEVRDTILHEIAHAIVGERRRWREEHDKAWRVVAHSIGARPEAFAGEEVRMPPHRWVGTCPACGEIQARRHRLLQWVEHSCGQCSDTWDPQFRLVWTEAEPAS